MAVWGRGVVVADLLVASLFSIGYVTPAFKINLLIMSFDIRLTGMQDGL